MTEEMEKEWQYIIAGQQNRLLILPCAVGSTVYEVYQDNAYTDYWWDISEAVFTLSYYEEHKEAFGKSIFGDLQKALEERDKRNGKI